MISNGLLLAGALNPHINLRTRGRWYVLLVLWFLSWGPRRMPALMTEERTERLLIWACRRVRIEQQVLEGGAWVEVANGWDYMRQAR